MPPRFAVLAVLVLALHPAAQARLFHRAHATPGGANLSLRKRLHVNTLITEPGTFELDWSGLYSFSSANAQGPAAFKWTPEGRWIAWGRTEYSVAFDSLDNTDSGGGRLTQFSQSLSFTATSLLHDGNHFDFAIAPQATLFLRDESGARLGATAIARYDSGRNSLGLTAGWSGATTASETNPAGVLDLGLGYGRNLSGARWLEKFTPHVNVIWERSSGHPGAVSLFEGVEYQLNDRIAFDLSAQHLGVSGGPRDHQIVFGFTFNFGHPRGGG